MNEEEKKNINIDTLILIVPREGKKYALPNSTVTVTANFNDDGSLANISGDINTSYGFYDTEIGEIQTWRYHFYNCKISKIDFDSSTEILKYHFVAEGFDINDFQYEEKSKKE